MSEKEKQLKNSFWYLIPVLVSNVLPIITIPIFTRILTVEDYGVYALAMVYAAFVNGLSNFGLTTGFERNFFENSDIMKRTSLLFTTLLFVLGTFLTSVFFTFIFKANLSGWVIGSSKYEYILFWALCAKGMLSLKTYYLTFFKNMENAKDFVEFTVIESLLYLLLSLFMVVHLRIGIIGLIWSQLLASTIVFLALSVKFLNSYQFGLDIHAFKISLRLSMPLTPRIFFGVIGKEFDKYMIGLLTTIGGVGVYDLGQRISNITFTFMTAIQNVFGPRVYKLLFYKGDEAKKSIGTYLTPFLYVSILIGLFISLFSEELIIVFTPKPYHGAIDIVSILCLLYGTYFFGKQPQLVYAKKTGLISVITLVGIFLNIGLNMPFIYKWGAIGAAWATL